MRTSQVKKYFSMIELLIVIVIMMILMYFTFRAYTGFINQGKITQTRLLITGLNTSLAKINTHVVSESRVYGITPSQHPLYAEGYKANRGRTIVDKEYGGGKLKANPLMDLIAKADLAFEEEVLGTEEIDCSAGTLTMLVDAFRNPIMIVRNEVAMALEAEKIRGNPKYREDVYKHREKTYVGGYMMYELDSSPGGKNLYEWNDKGFVKDYNVLTETTAGSFCDMYDKIMIPYAKNGFDIWSAGPDGMIANLIPKDHKEDRWKNFRDGEGTYNWVTYKKVNTNVNGDGGNYPVDRDDDNISEIKGTIDNDTQ